MKRKSNAEFIVSVLELFDGQISIDDILEKEIPLVYDLLDAKDELIKEKERLRIEAENKAMNSK